MRPCQWKASRKVEETRGNFRQTFKKSKLSVLNMGICILHKIITLIQFERRNNIT